MFKKKSEWPRTEEGNRQEKGGEKNSKVNTWVDITREVFRARNRVPVKEDAVARAKKARDLSEGLPEKENEERSKRDSPRVR